MADDEHSFWSLFSGKDAPATFGCLIVLAIVICVFVWKIFLDPSKPDSKSDTTNPTQIQSRPGTANQPE